MPTKPKAKRPVRKIVLPPFHAAQVAIVDSVARFSVIAAGRRWGKGVMAVTEAFKRGIAGKKCRWVSPTYASDSFQAGWAIALNLAKQIPGVEVHLQRREIDFSRLGGGWLQFRTAEEPDSLRGEGIDFIVFDEAAHIKNLKDIWEQSVRPSLMDRKGDAWFISTPKGFNYFNELYKKGEAMEPGWASFHCKTLDNPLIAPSEVDELRKNLPALVARQEIDAEFVILAGALFRREHFDDRIVEADRVPKNLSWVRSWDLAFTKNTASDFTAGAKGAVDLDGNVWIADMRHCKGQWPEVVRLIASTAREDGGTCVQAIECVGAQVGMLDTLMADPSLVSVPFEPLQVNADKISRALAMLARCEAKRMWLVRGEWNKGFIDELCAFPQGDHDDMVDAASGLFQKMAVPTGEITAGMVSGLSTGNPTFPQHGGGRHWPGGRSWGGR